MKISDYSINKIGEFIAGDVAGWPYRRGADLVEFFNKLGFRDVYEEGFPTRRVYAQGKLKELNNKPKLKDAFREALDPRLWIDYLNGTVDEAAAKLNEIIRYDGYEVILDGNFYKVRELSGSIIEVEKRFDEISELSELLIEEQIKKSREKVELGDYSGAITNSRSLIEAVCLSILNESNQTQYENDGDLNKLFTQTRKVLNLDPGRKDISDSLKQVLSGLSSIVSGLSSIRNKMSDAHAGNYKPSRHHAKLAVNAAKTLADFLFETKAYQKEKGIL
ncbi:MAG: abortive infection family protein [Methylotenera sp.]